MVRETLTRGQIVAGAINLLDAEGIEALTMRRLGQHLASAATSMYWHVGNKENLVVLAGDQAWTEVELPDIERHGWRGAAAQLARNTYDMLTRHHWLVSAISTHYVYGPGMARYQDHHYAIYQAAGFEGAELDRAYETVFNYVVGMALSKSYETAMRTRLSAEDDGEMRFAELLRRAEETAGEFPRLKARIEAQRDIDVVPVERESLDYGLDTIFDGLEARLAQRG
ncbi:TetR/AcrR family transcriptional regulator [Nesterenkonia ebinurensis]|uniref:TetR/AcrR family transcriptional regulator n=1 Tax=Nesterenkonia ebinurensis TaxID=2608252 RepID=UPI00123CACFA|nr:TetR/AcrR family transcriptional regulator C-terminal domain-containing protein [Nesterenkonia ebinurensis]